MRRLLTLLAIATISLSAAHAQSTLVSPVNVNGTAGQFRMDFDISAPCTGGTTSAAGRATICGNNNTVTVSVNGAPAFTLAPGQAGPMGPIGPQGPAGAAGPQGVAGPTGPTGAKGATGATGPQGPIGPTGATGPIGPAGAAGLPGTQGPAGAQGAMGPQGPAGPTGATGSQGPAGVVAAPIDYALVTHAGLSVSGSQTWAMPANLNELFGDTVRVQVDLTSASQVRVYGQIGSNYGPAGAILYCQYSTDGGTTWKVLTNSAAANSTGAHVSTWATVPSGAKQDLLVRAVSKYGNGSDVDIEAFHLQVK